MLRGIFFQHTQKEKENLHNNIYCAGGRMCAKENTPHYPQKAAQWKNNAFSSLKQRHVFTKNTPSFFKITAYFFSIMNRLIISNDGNAQSGTVSSHKNIPFMSDEHAKNKYVFKNFDTLNRNSTNKHDEDLLKLRREKIFL